MGSEQASVSIKRDPIRAALRITAGCFFPFLTFLSGGTYNLAV